MGKTPTLNVTPLATDTLAALEGEERYVVHEGSTRSSKTQSIAQALLVTAVRREVEVDVVRKSRPVLKRSAMKDFENWLRKVGLYDEDRHNKTENIYLVPVAGQSAHSKVSFFGADEEQKLRGPERDICWLNEANEIGADAFKQIRRRTRETLVLDYNPSHGASHWIDQDVIGSGREVVIHSTYRDNPFLPDAQVADIEADVPVYREADGTEVVDWTLDYDGDGVLIAGDPSEWAVNGLGTRAKSDRIIYPHWTIVDRLPEDYDDRAFGLDFGWNDPCVLVECRWKDVPGEDRRLYWHEVLRETKVRTSDLIDLFEDQDVPKSVPIYCDHEPDRIEGLCGAGYNAKPAEKDVGAGIRQVKEHRLIVTRPSNVLRSELEGYQWQTTKDGEVLDDPVKARDHGPDAGRYGAHTHYVNANHWLLS